jgi:hypothetical protein
MKAILRDPPLLFMAGIMGMAAGLAIVLSHNISMVAWACANMVTEMAIK